MRKILQTFKTIFTLLFLGMMITGNAQFEEQEKLVGDLRESRAEFGTSVDFNDNFIAVGASRETIASGAVYVYRTEGDNIEFHQRLTAFDAAEGAEFGGIVRFMDDYLVVASGRSNIEDAFMAGSLYIYKLDTNNEWTFHTKLIASDYQSTALLGANPTSLDTYENILAVGAMAHDSWTGAVYIFENNEGAWTETQKIEVPDAVLNGNFGIGVSISKNYLIVGASGANNGRGKAYIFQKNEENGLWEFEHDVVASDAQNNTYFGTSVSVDENQFVVGAYAEQSMSSDVPAAYIFERDMSGQWNQVQRIGSHEAGEDTYFGWHCEMVGDMLFVAAPHVFGVEESRVNVYKKTEEGLWEEFFTVTPSDNVNAFFGWHFAYHGNRLLVGAPRNDFDENGQNEMGDAGAAFMFKQTTLGMEEITFQNAITVYPNPVKNQLTVVSKEDIKSIEIFNISGQKVGSAQNKTANVSTLPKGNYFIKIKMSSGNTKTLKFIKN